MSLKGIGISADIYVSQNYYTPDTYTIPAASVGDYFTPQGYVAGDYVLESLDLSSVFTIEAIGEINSVKATLSSTFTLTAQGQDFDLASATLSSSFAVSCEGGYFLTGSSTMASAVSTTANGNATYDPQKTITSQTAVSSNANVAYTAAPTLDSILTAISVGGIIYNAFQEGRQDDYTWDTFAESEYIDRTWNEWFGAQWHPGLIAFGPISTLSCNGGLVFGGVANDITATFTTSQNGNMIFDDTAAFSSAYTISTDYIRQRNADPASYSSSFTTAQNGNIIIDSNTKLFNILSSSTQNGNVIFDQPSAYNITISTTQNGNVIFDPTKTVNAVISFSNNSNVKYDSSASFSAFNTQLSAGRLITIADPWNILKVKQEIRAFKVIEESRTILVLEEMRVNSITTETRSIQVPQETRKFKIYKPQFSNRSSIPKVRTEA